MFICETLKKLNMFILLVTALWQKIKAKFIGESSKTSSEHIIHHPFISFIKQALNFNVIPAHNGNEIYQQIIHA